MSTSSKKTQTVVFLDAWRPFATVTDPGWLIPPHFDDPGCPKGAHLGAQGHICVDVARGGANDYSAFTVIDISTVPYRMIAKYRNNEIKPLIFPEIIYNIAVAYNNAYILVEINDIGARLLMHYIMIWSMKIL